MLVKTKPSPPAKKPLTSVASFSFASYPMISLTHLSRNFIVMCFLACLQGIVRHVECHHTEGHYAEGHYAESHHAECHHAEYHYAECHYAVIMLSVI